MYSIIKQVLERGGYELSTVLHKVKSLWVEGEITDEQRDELETTARAGANAQHSVDVLAKLEEFEGRLRALENASAETPTEEYPAYIEGKWYYAGDSCTFDGSRYTCIAPAGVVCVWSPAAYPAYWQTV